MSLILTLTAADGSTGTITLPDPVVLANSITTVISLFFNVASYSSIQSNKIIYKPGTGDKDLFWLGF